MQYVILGGRWRENQTPTTVNVLSMKQRVQRTILFGKFNDAGTRKRKTNTQQRKTTSQIFHYVKGSNNCLLKESFYFSSRISRTNEYSSLCLCYIIFSFDSEEFSGSLCADQ